MTPWRTGHFSIFGSLCCQISSGNCETIVKNVQFDPKASESWWNFFIERVLLYSV